MRRQADRPDARVLLDEQGAVLREVPGEEYDEDDLEQLRRLPAERADDEGEPLPADVRAEHEGQQQERDAGRGPRVLVPAEPAVRADDDCERRRDGQRQEQPDELDLAEPLGAEEPRADEVLRQPLHQQQADPAEHPDGGQQDLVRPAPGDDEREVRREQRAQVDREGQRVQRHPQRQVEQVGAVPGRPGPSHPGRRSRRRARPRRAASSRSSSQRGRGRMGPRTRGSSRCRTRRGRMRSWRALAPAASGPGRSAPRRRTRAGRPHRPGSR